MFSFHKPKVYRSTQGCCICKAKSSSSRFTDSKKYEDDFIECFQLVTPRQGEICNACVLLVKRFKRLPPGSERHWSHVVDARIGPGIKSMTKFKKRKEEQLLQQQNDSNGNAKEFAGQSKTNAQNIQTSSMCGNGVAERFGKIFKKTKKKKMTPIKAPKLPNGSSDENSEPSSPVSTNSDAADIDNNSRLIVSNDTRTGKLFTECFDSTLIDQRKNIIRRLQRKSYRPLKNRNRSVNQSLYLIDNEFWVQVKTCCGFVYENQTIGALLIDTNTLTSTRCAKHDQTNQNASIVKQENDIAMSTYKPITLSTASLPLKKQHTLGKRIIESNLLDAVPIIKSESTYTQIIDTNIQSNAIDYSKVQPPPLTNKLQTKISKSIDSNVRSQNYLHKLKSDSGKIMKNSIERLAPSKMKVTDLNVVKNLVKFCTDKSAVGKRFNSNATTTIKCNTNSIIINPLTETTSAIHNENENNSNKIIEALATNKFSDNSSDSGYEETLHDTAQLNQIAKIGPSRSVILSNGIKLHVQPQNLLLAANLAGVSQTAIQTTQANLKATLLSQQQHHYQHQLHQSNQFNGVQNGKNIASNTSTMTTVGQSNIRINGSSVSNKNVYVVKPKLLTVNNI